MSTTINTNIEQLKKQVLQLSIDNLVDTYLNFDPETRCNLLNSVRGEARHWSGCDPGAVMEFIWRVFNKYNEDDSKEGPGPSLEGSDSKTILSKRILDGLRFDPNDRYFYWLDLSSEMCDRFIHELNRHYEWVQQGYSCEEDYIASKCEECATIYDNYMYTDPCSACGTVWWTVTKSS